VGGLYGRPFFVTPPPARVIAYVDGFNFYHGAIAETPYKWLDLETMIRRLRNEDDIIAIRYFTAEMVGPSGARQRIYWDALRTSSLIRIELGSFKKISVTCKTQACIHTGNRSFDRMSEKRTDVNIALRMVEDALDNACDMLILISGDSDLVPAVKMVQDKFKKKVSVYVPCRAGDEEAAIRRSDELRQTALIARPFPSRLLAVSLFPEAFTDAAGAHHTKPANW
jgi:uncharacterized LabA/DUF88 family protein